VSYRMTAMVRACRFPRRLRRRCPLKAVLLALADRADDEGNGAWPSVRTIAAETELRVRTVEGLLMGLASMGVIFEQAPPRQHRPRTWGLRLEAIAALSVDTQRAAGLEPSASNADAQRLAGLAPGPVPVEGTPDPQVSTSDPQTSAPDPVLLNGLNGQGNRAAAHAPRVPPSDIEMLRKCYPSVRALAAAIVEAEQAATFADLERQLIVKAQDVGLPSDPKTCSTALRFVLMKRNLARRSAIA
jgi:Helix-turn-helix domain